MKVVILAGGYGTRLGEETGVKPKPMVEIGSRPIIWHIMKHYSHYGFNEFIILCGYKGHMLKEYFANYYLRNSSITFDLKNNSFEVISSSAEHWKVTCLDTGTDTLTGGRIKKAEEFIGNSPFLLTYGDGLSDINLEEVIQSHKKSNSVCTLSAVRPVGRFGMLGFDQHDKITNFTEKNENEIGWINGGFFVCAPEIFKYIGNSESAVFEKGTLDVLAQGGLLNSYKHHGFWKCMDTLADKESLEKMWQDGNPAWQIW